MLEKIHYLEWLPLKTVTRILVNYWLVCLLVYLNLNLAQQSESCRKRKRWTGGIQEWSCWIPQYGELHNKAKKCLISEIHVSDL